MKEAISDKSPKHYLLSIVKPKLNSGFRPARNLGQDVTFGICEIDSSHLRLLTVPVANDMLDKCIELKDRGSTKIQSEKDVSQMSDDDVAKLITAAFKEFSFRQTP